MIALVAGVTRSASVASYSLAESRSCVSEMAPRRSASLASRRAGAAVGGDAELVVQVRQVLLDRGLRDDELLGDRARRRRLGEHVAGQQRAAQRQEDVALARGQRRRRLVGLRHRRAGGQRVAEHEPRLADPDLVAVSQSARGPDPLAVDPRAVGGSEVGHAPARREAFEHRVQAAGGRVVVERRRRSRAPCRSSSGPPRARRASCARRRSPRSAGPRGQASSRRSGAWQAAGRGAVHGRYEVLETLGAGGEARSSRRSTISTSRFVALKIRPVRDEARARTCSARRACCSAAAASGAAAGPRGLLRRDDYVVAMDWVDGTDLATLLAERGAPGPGAVERGGLPRRGRRGADVPALAVAAGHPRRRQARQPDPDSRAARIKLVDFGLSSAPKVPGAARRHARLPRPRAGGGRRAVARERRLRAGGDRLRAADRLGPRGVLPDLGGHRPGAGRAARGRDPARDGDGPGATARRRRASSSSACAAGWSAALPTGVTTFCLSDIVGSTALWEPDPRRDGRGARPPRRADRRRRGGARRPLDQVDGRGRRDRLGVRVGARRGRGGDRRRPRARRRAMAAGLEHRRRAWGSTPARPSGATPTTSARRSTSRRACAGRPTAARSSCRGSPAELVADAPAGGVLARRPRPHRLKGLRAGAHHALAGPGVTRRRRRPSAPTAACWRSSADDRAFFFGREAVLGSIVERLAPRRLLALVGASGSGKSSLLRAGLIAAAGAGEVAGCGTPAADAGASRALDADAATLVVVDQFEELYTLCDDADRARALHRRAAGAAARWRSACGPTSTAS